MQIIFHGDSFDDIHLANLLILRVGERVMKWISCCDDGDNIGKFEFTVLRLNWATRRLQIS